MTSRNSGFHRLDADWTRGREQAIADAESIARRQLWPLRQVSLKENANAEGGAA